MDKSRQLVYRINENGQGPELLHQVFMERGWTEHDEEVFGHSHRLIKYPDWMSPLCAVTKQRKIHGENGWNIWWRTTRFRTGDYNDLMSWQRINHYPNCTTITRKDALCRNLRKMSIAHGLSSYNFSPTAYNLPNDYTKFVSDYAKLKQQHPKEDPPLMWICKPAESSRGRGIFIFSDLSELQYDCNAVVQQYITDPLLIGGYKFDIRVYVAVPSFQPLQIYVHEEGLVRFSTEKYDLDRPDNVFAHLTNTSINKYSPGYTTDKEEVGCGCKWTITRLRRYFLQNNIPDGLLWQRVTNIIILTLLIQASSAPKATNCFELYGFDILVDSSLKPWLLEVNFSPALSSDCQNDIIAKKAMLHDLLDLIFRTEAGFDFDFDIKRGLPSRDGLTDRTVASVASTSKACRSISGLSLQRPRPTGSTHTVHSDRSVQSLDKTDRDVSTYQRLRKPQSFNNTKNKTRSKSRRGKEELPAIERRKSSLKSPAPWLEGRNLSRPGSEIEHPKQQKGSLSKESSNHIITPKNSLSDLQSGDKLRKGHGKKSKSELAKVRDLGDMKLPDGNVKDEGLSIELQNNNTNSKVATSRRLSQDCESGGNTITETPVEPVDSKTSTTSDSGLSSLSLNSSDNNCGAGSESKSHTVLAEGSTHEVGTNTNSSNSVSNVCVDSDPTFPQNELPPKLILSDAHHSTGEMEMIDILCSEHDKNNTEIKIVHGNMRGLGIKKIISPIASPGLSKSNRLHLRRSSNSHTTMDNYNSEHKRTLKQGRLQAPPRSQLAVYDPHPADNKKLLPFSIPRNFSRLESHRFPFHYHHSRNPGKNGKAPLTKIPSRKVGKFFLVFPFSEATQKLSLGKLDPKLVIKELQKHNRDTEKARKTLSSANSPASEDLGSGIWSPFGEA